MRSKILSLAGAGLVLMAVGAWSQPARAQWAPSTDCDQYGGYELDNCLNDANTAADAALNAAYAKAGAYIDATQDIPADKTSWHDELRAAQRAWIAFRDANCAFDLIVAEWNSGSGANAAQKACVLAMTLARTDELTKRYTAN
ncbi:lysozyme inhibitor LprI family protein [Aureimonas frigidaquae]|uniref:lysozyme inhibitor LprI family protein n=1 Tax=Aureimonas frigidaquae TaxID=424757 RepID=UPI00078505DF|nr:lysozyme inhibitor LprI family protein [Aureimonas frigidaquae]